MSTVTSDGQSFFVDGRRIWLVSGAMHYLRTPRELWRSRLDAARQAGLNCIETYVFWAAHEPKPGKFDFKGDKDLRAFVQLCGEMGFFVIIRPGPYACAELDFGGFPAWLHRVKDVRYREANQPYLEACSRYLGAVMTQIKGLQITGAGPKNPPPRKVAPGAVANGYAGQGGGPILLMQVENEWMSDQTEVGQKYFTELTRYLRENGCTTPLMNCNNLVYRHEGTIDAWNGSEQLAANLRQLAVVQPDQPRLAAEYWTGWFDHWGDERTSKVDPQKHLYRLAEILGAGAQPNMFMFHGGTNFGFSSGRTVNTASCYITTSYDYDAPLKEAGGRGEKFALTKRIATFASHFAQTFANLRPADHALAAVQHDTAGVSVVHLRGEVGGKGDVVFVTRGAKDKTARVDLMLPNGLQIPVYMGKDRAAWFVLDAELGDAARLDLTNLRPLAFIDNKMLVVYGPAGTDGVVVVDGTEYQATVPTGKTPLIETHIGGRNESVTALNDPNQPHEQAETPGITLVVLNEQQADAAYPGGSGLIVGAAGLDEAGAPIPLKGWANRYEITVDGELTKPKQTPPRKASAPKLTQWSAAACAAMATPKEAKWQTIEGPASHEALGLDMGYGLYRIQLTKPVTGTIVAPLAEDRIHVYADGKFQAVLGRSPGAIDEPTKFTLGKDNLILSDHLARYTFGSAMGEVKGLPHHFAVAAKTKLAAPSVENSAPCDPSPLAGYLAWGYMSKDAPLDLTSKTASTMTWSLRLTVKKPLLLEIDAFPDHWMLTANGEPVTFQMNDGPVRRQILLDPRTAPFRSGANRIELSLANRLDPKLKLADHIRIFELSPVTDGSAKWSFMPLAEPTKKAYEAAPAGGFKTETDRPTWYRAEFNVKDTDTPLFLDPAGLTKGQIYLNGHNAGRYFVRTHSGAAVPPQSRYYLPEPWLKTDGPNELVLFEEHGRTPGKVKLVYDADGPYG